MDRVAVSLSPLLFTVRAETDFENAQPSKTVLVSFSHTAIQQRDIFSIETDAFLPSPTLDLSSTSPSFLPPPTLITNVSQPSLLSPRMPRVPDSDSDDFSSDAEMDDLDIEAVEAAEAKYASGKRKLTAADKGKGKEPASKKGKGADVSENLTCS